MMPMLLKDFDEKMRALLELQRFENADVAMNGLQVAGPNAGVHRMAFAVDASMESFKRARGEGADLLFVHHGLFWGRPLAITAGHFERVKFLIDNGLALYAVHLPLDAHPELGNNVGLAGHLELVDLSPFGEYKGIKIGTRGRWPQPVKVGQVADRLCGGRARCLGILPFGPDLVQSAGIVSGGAPECVREAIDLGLDLFVTGDASHEIYHTCLEAGINVIFGGHYITETWGIRGLAEHIGRNPDLTTLLLDIPTGL